MEQTIFIPNFLKKIMAVAPIVVYFVCSALFLYYSGEPDAPPIIFWLGVLFPVGVLISIFRAYITFSSKIIVTPESVTFMRGNKMLGEYSFSTYEFSYNENQRTTEITGAERQHLILTITGANGFLKGYPTNLSEKDFNRLLLKIEGYVVKEK